MSKFTNFGENSIADFFRGQGITLPANWYFVPGSAGSDAGVTEITGVGLSRAAVPRSLVKFKSTQNDSIASTGTSKLTSNTDAISFGTPTGSGTLTHVGIADAVSSGNVWMWAEVDEVAFTNGSPSPLQLAPGAVKFRLGRLGGATHYLVNKMIDLLFRGQAYTWPTTLGLSYFTTAPTDAGGGTEASGGSYARVSLIPGTSSISGTQAPASTTASSGSGGRISNNVLLQHPDPSADQGDALATGVHDATTAGNLLWWKALASPITIVSGGPAPFYAPDTWAITLA